jgi:UDP-N-acetylmuramoyl-tripeptide--D-alanyl-D-alanine ligase
MTIEYLYDVFLKHPVISTDTRKIEADSIFFALKGEKFDANTFAKQAIEAGAAYVVIDNPDFKFGEKYLLVDDSLKALQDLARYHRQQLNIPVFGLTGTNGKTTTKELIFSVLSQKYKTLATQGNLNNHIGVPLTILNINASHQMAVIEMGANHQKEIAFLCTISQPTHGLITNVGKAHLEGFGGVEGVKIGKGELYDYLKGIPKVRKSESPKEENFGNAKESGVVFVNSNSADLMKMQADRGLKNVVFYGTGGNNNSISGHLTENSPYLSLNWVNSRSGESHNIKTQLTGAYNLDNILAAICVGAYFGLNNGEINSGVEGYQPKNNRSQIVRTATNTLICDYYNANPSSMFVAIENMDKIEANHKVLILGDMFELGDEAAAEHLVVTQKAIATDAKRIIFIGKEFYALSPEVGIPIAIGTESPKEEKDNGSPLLELSPTNRNAPGHRIAFFQTTEEASVAIKADPVKNSTVLIKGSRGMALERLVELF